MFDFDQYLGFLVFLTIITIGFLVNDIFDIDYPILDRRYFIRKMEIKTRGKKK